jgi:hypothetical protein
MPEQTRLIHSACPFVYKAGILLGRPASRPPQNHSYHILTTILFTERASRSAIFLFDAVLVTKGCIQQTIRRFSPQQNATMVKSQSLRVDRLANGPFKLMSTPVHAQKQTVSIGLLIFLSSLLGVALSKPNIDLRIITEAIRTLCRGCQCDGTCAQCHHPWSE